MQEMYNQREKRRLCYYIKTGTQSRINLAQKLCKSHTLDLNMTHGSLNCTILVVALQNMSSISFLRFEDID